MIFPHDKKRVEKICVVLGVVDDPLISGVVPLAQSGQAIHMMRVPIAKMLDVRMLFFNLPEDSLLVVAILKEAGGGALRRGPRSQNTRQLNVMVGTFLLIGPDEPPAGLMGRPGGSQNQIRCECHFGISLARIIFITTTCPLPPPQ